MVTAIVGANWGDEGKGKITDVKAAESDIVVRFQGGSNAGHTIINNYGKFALHQLPSGVFYDHITNEDMERIKVMQRYLFLNHDITENEFFGELKKKFKDYYKLIERYPYKKLTFIDLQIGDETNFASTIEAYEDLHPKKRFLNIFGKSK